MRNLSEESRSFTYSGIDGSGTRSPASPLGGKNSTLLNTKDRNTESNSPVQLENSIENSLRLKGEKLSIKGPHEKRVCIVDDEQMNVMNKSPSYDVLEEFKSKPLFR